MHSARSFLASKAYDAVWKVCRAAACIVSAIEM